MTEAGIFFLSRWKYKVILYNPQTKKELDLRQLLRGKSHIDMQVLCGKTEQAKVRLVAIKLPPAQAAERIRKAKKDGKKKTNHSAEYYELLNYVIFITNVDKTIWNYKEVAMAYRVRWNIEILFKSWKSGLNIERMIPEAQLHTERVESILYLLLLYISWFQLLIYAPLFRAFHAKGKYLSVIKAAKWMIANTDRWMTGKVTLGMEREILYSCCYESRLRINATQRLELFFNTLT
jgi:IS4 transposase